MIIHFQKQKVNIEQAVQSDPTTVAGNEIECLRNRLTCCSGDRATPEAMDVTLYSGHLDKEEPTDYTLPADSPYYSPLSDCSGCSICPYSPDV
jgi:hypothetical protein